jgi:excisionase family DNA binding protein
VLPPCNKGRAYIADKQTPITEWITTAEAAELTGYHVKYVRRLIREGKVSGAKRGRDWWVDKASVEEYIDEMKKLGTAKHDPRGTATGNR